MKIEHGLIMLVIILFSGSFSQEGNYPESFKEPIKLFDEALGDFHFPISSRVENAQRFFNQGFQLMYAFAKEDAARSFQASHLADPECAICWWGEAWAWGSYLNGAMTTAQAPRAYFALQQAMQRIDSATQKESDMIHALQARYIKDFKPETRRIQDQAYADAMAILAEKYPNDEDLLTLYGDALFLLEERRGYRSLTDPNVERLHKVLLSVLEKNIKHPGACHLLVHATESTATPELAAPCAKFLGNTIPGASHINHMPSHTWNELGLWHEAVRANITASHSDQKAAIGQGFSIYPTHNLTMLYYAASMGGESATAIQAAKDLAKLNNNTAMLSLALVRFGRFDEVLKINNKPNGEINISMYDFAQGYAALKDGNIETAQKVAGSLEKLANSTNSRFRFHDGKDIIGTMAAILEGEIAWHQGNLEAAADSFRLAIDYYENLNYDEPEPLPFSPRHWLGAAYMAMGAHENALKQYQKDLTEHPNNIWGLWGAQQASRKMAKPSPSIDTELVKAFSFADIWLPDTKF